VSFGQSTIEQGKGVGKMETNRIKMLVVSLVVFLLLLPGLSFASVEGYDAMKGVSSTSAIFDMRDSNVQTAAIHLNLIHDTYKELVAMNKNPVFVVVFMGGAVKLISTDHRGFSAEQEKFLKEIAGIISRM
jgi:uncharacterized oligopeptide transporter (OPT) family protein